jgi:hypothetical protein
VRLLSVAALTAQPRGAAGTYGARTSAARPLVQPVQGETAVALHHGEHLVTEVLEFGVGESDLGGSRNQVALLFVGVGNGDERAGLLQGRVVQVVLDAEVDVEFDEACRRKGRGVLRTDDAMRAEPTITPWLPIAHDRSSTAVTTASPSLQAFYSSAACEFAFIIFVET